MWNFRTGDNSVLTRKQAEAIGLTVPNDAVGIRLKIEPIYSHGFGNCLTNTGFDAIQFGQGVVWSSPVAGNAGTVPMPFSLKKLENVEVGLTVDWMRGFDVKGLIHDLNMGLIHDLVFTHGLAVDWMRGCAECACGRFIMRWRHCGGDDLLVMEIEENIRVLHRHHCEEIIRDSGGGRG